MYNYSKFLSAICAGMLVLGASLPVTSARASEAIAQAKATVQVKGVVLDTNDEPIIGASVIETGTQSNGTLTGADGSFSITITKGASIKISYVGYKTVTLKPSAGKTVNVTLEEDSEVLNDVVVVGYGTQRKKLVTGATVHVTSEKIAELNAVDAFGALQSQAAGMNIVMNSGQPGESYKVVIRGMGTAGSNTPLYVIDGVPGGSLTDISPNDMRVSMS